MLNKRFDKNELDRKKTLLIVEDDEEVAFLLRDILGIKGYRCLIESEGEAVMDRVRQDRPDLLLLDIKLVGIDGYTVCRRLKKEPSTRQIPVIFISALNSERDVMEAQEAGGVYFVAKPFDIHFLTGKIEEVIAETTSESPHCRPERKVVYVQSDTLPEAFRTDDAILEIFKDSEFIAFPVHDPRNTLRKAKEVHADAIILDMDDALLSVQNVASAVWRNKDTHRIPVIVLSTAQESGWFHYRGVPSVAAVMQKPVSKSKLMEKIRQAISDAAGHRKIVMPPEMKKTRSESNFVFR